MTAIELFLSPGNEGGQTLQDGLSQDSLSHTGAKESAKAVQFPDPGGDPNSLADQGWGVVVPKTDEGDRLLELVKPLIDKRNEDCGRDVSIYRVKPDMDASKTITWRDRRFVGNEYQEDIPWYLLILGQPDQVSLEFQQVMSNNSLVGRLAFDRDEHYQAYIDKLLAWEKKTPGQELARTVFFTAVDGTAAERKGLISGFGHHRARRGGRRSRRPIARDRGRGTAEHSVFVQSRHGRTAVGLVIVGPPARFAGCAMPGSR